MKAKLPRRARASRPNVESKLNAYSTLSNAALATAVVAAVGATATASAQAITNITFSGDLGGSLHTLTVPGGTGNLSNEVHIPGLSVNSVLRLRVGRYTGSNYDYRRLYAKAGWGMNRHSLLQGRTSLGGPGVLLNNANAAGEVGGAVFRRYGSTGSHVTDGVFQIGPGQSKTGYLGFATQAGKFGWVNLRVTADGDGFPLSISFWDKNGDDIIGAYGTAGIHVGQVSAIPEPSTVAIGLGLFALGAAGVREHRRRKLAA